MEVRNVYRLICCWCKELWIQIHHGGELHDQNMRHALTQVSKN